MVNSISQQNKKTAAPISPPSGFVPRPGQVVLGDIGMRIAADGVWYYRGSPIGRHSMVKLFATVLRRDADGVYWLITPAEMARVQIDDAPFVVIELTATTAALGRVLHFRTNIDASVCLDADHPLRIETAANGEPRPYVQVAGDGSEALISRNVFYELVTLGETRVIDGISLFGIESAGLFHALGPDPDERPVDEAMMGTGGGTEPAAVATNADE